ncbi:MAG TPA: alpha-amylase [Kosmotogaceae bacterium]|nr:MAG: Alpha amylase catalytic region [Thermotogales bacterium 46_20]HAA85236.1 alpha-amylase [Kosmotogaceae bacterium]
MYYELFLRSFADGNGDGIGDLQGATEKLDYISALGMEGIWLLPIMSSPSYHGYTVTDFYNVNPIYGDIKDLRLFLAEAHKRDLKVILDLPLNHTSTNHEWFLRALNGERPYSDWYLWLEDESWLKARRPWDKQKVWTPIGSTFYYSLFGPGSPDLNYDSESLWHECRNILTFWLSLGFDGFRFDAAKHIFDFSKKIGNCEYQHDRNIAFWSDMTSHSRKINPEAIFVSEVWDDWETVEKYSSTFGIGFNFPLSYVIKEAIEGRSVQKFIDGFRGTMPHYFTDNRSFESGVFLTNHDMTRLVTNMNGNQNQAIFALSMLMSVPGIPFVFYGEELGMEGVYNELFNEEQLEPFPWYESGFGPGQTEWKAVDKNRPGMGRSYEKQSKSNESFLSRFRKTLLFRKERPWLRWAKVDNIYEKSGCLCLELTQGTRRISFIYNLSDSAKNLCIEKTIHTLAGSATTTDNGINLKAWSCAVIE